MFLPILRLKYAKKCFVKLVKTCCELDKTSKFVKPDSKMNHNFFIIRRFYCLYLSGFWIGTERNFSKWNHDGCQTSQNCGWKMQKWHKTAEICHTSRKLTHFQISKACFFDLSFFHLQFSFILIDGLFYGPIFVQNSQKTNQIIKKFHRNAKLIKLNYK